MAHKGRYYPYAPRRDLSICTIPMLWWGKRALCYGFNFYNPFSGVSIPFNITSNDVIVDETNGTYEYYFDPVVYFVWTLELYIRGRLTFDAHETEVYRSMTVNGVTVTRTIVGPIPGCMQNISANLQVGSGFTQLIWTQGIYVPGPWLPSDNP